MIYSANARLNFPGAEQILDFYHASEHLGTLAQSIWLECLSRVQIPMPSRSNE